jgi:diguanylate cyclase (GGDEF)-like protein
MMLDIDYFKQFNDSYGHTKGDQAIKEVAAALSRSLQRATDFAARIGGEEFAVLMPNTDLAGARSVAELIRSSVESCAIPHQHSPISEFLTVSVGGATCIPGKANGLPEFVESVDQTLYKAKSSGRNCVKWLELE